MRNMKVRIETISLENFKNVEKGTISFMPGPHGEAASILGVYGQNGSGKTALIDAVEILQKVITGSELNSAEYNYIMADKPWARLDFMFSIEDEERGEKGTIWYSFKLKKELKEAEEQPLAVRETKQTKQDEDPYQTVVFDEGIDFSLETATEKQRRQTMIKTDTDDIFEPKNKQNAVVGNDTQAYMKLMVEKELALRTGKSFAWHHKLASAFSKSKEYKKFGEFLGEVRGFARNKLYIVNAGPSGGVRASYLPLPFFIADDHMVNPRFFTCPLNEAALMSYSDVQALKGLLPSLNLVLGQLVPGLAIDVKEFGEELDRRGETQVRIQLISVRNGKEIPLKYESEGIKKLLSVLQLLIVMYNFPTVTVVIDELDAGIFEYLLGELLGVIAMYGKGQLMFTSHNLRALETLDKNFVAFTTTNPMNRYIRMQYVKPNNNLRDFYYRNIVLGGQKDELYDETDSNQIAIAMRKAGAVVI